MMHGYGGTDKGVIKPDFNRSVQIDFKGAKVTSVFPLAHHYRAVLGYG